MPNGEEGAKNARKFAEYLKAQGLTILGREHEESIQSGGWPDFVVKRGEVYEMYELKGGQHPLDSHQKEILQMLLEIGGQKVKIYLARYRSPDDDTPEVTPFNIEASR